jgi:hypothetical protein
LDGGLAQQVAVDATPGDPETFHVRIPIKGYEAYHFVSF